MALAEIPKHERRTKTAAGKMTIIGLHRVMDVIDWGIPHRDPFKSIRPKTPKTPGSNS